MKSCLFFKRKNKQDFTTLTRKKERVFLMIKWHLPIKRTTDFKMLGNTVQVSITSSGLGRYKLIGVTKNYKIYLKGVTLCRKLPTVLQDLL
ncbi:hypothetical protein QV09_10885 [Gallibacterium salpingitidis]|uniref:Uncharacterized protein n=1 Tax=Gallibacterium salpingitidis TaxID=505341 RepID=A0AB36E017_9PAST|nr:hypothetical protein QV09_10885 [Gallibacterium salpingitidis]